jgi:hypothetical protein
MRWLVSLLLLIALSLQQGLKMGVIGWWLWNREEIAQTLCENRDQPELDCCGKCVLSKKLQQVDKAPEKNTDKEVLKKSIKEEPAVVPERSSLPIPEPVYSVSGTYPAVPAAALLAGLPEPPFHPPQA